jgi:hypothetical protein
LPGFEYGVEQCKFQHSKPNWLQNMKQDREGNEIGGFTIRIHKFFLSGARNFKMYCASAAHV